MNSTRKNMSIAGLLYLIVAATGGFAFYLVHNIFIIPDDITATIINISDSGSLFRIGIVSDLICQCVFVFLVFVLFRLFLPVNKNHAILMIILALVGVPIASINILSEFAFIKLSEEVNYLTVLGKDQLNLGVQFFLSMQSSGVLIAQIFWGLWLLPLGLLVLRSHFIPHIFGVLLIISSLIYAGGSFTSFLQMNSQIIFDPLYYLSAFSEISFCLFLLIKGTLGSQINDS